jgi:hypothetical protein
MKLKATPIHHRRMVWPWIIAVSILLIAACTFLPKEYRNGSVLLSAVGTLWALAFYLHGRHADHAKFAKELKTDFNNRYDSLSTDLQRGIWREGSFEVDVKLKFIKYFNLCAEEWLFWRAGYIYDPVWDAWHNGMKQYSKDSRVMAIWADELKTDSYYGFEFPKV